MSNSWNMACSYLIDMNQMIELRHLRFSHQVKRLEQLVGDRLFDRTTRGVKLTLAGQLLADRARSTIEKVDDDLEQVRRLGRGEEGTLTVGFSGSVMFTDLPTAIESYRRRYPKVELRLRELSTQAQIPALLDGTLDLAFMRDGDPTEGVQMTTLFKEPYVAVLPKVHALAHKRSFRVGDLRNEPFILFARRMGPLAFDRTMACCERSGFRPNIVQDAPQWPTLVRLVAAGLGVSLAPACVANVTLPGAVYRDAHAPRRTTVDLGVKVGSDKTLTKNFMQIAREHLAK